MPKKSQRQQTTDAQLITWYKWEFLRRNPEYRKDYDAFIAEFGSWFDEHGYWYDQTTEPWGTDNFRFFASVIAPRARVICENWAISDPYSPDWGFTREGDLIPSFGTKLSMISAKERGSGYVEEQSHGSADDRGAETTGSRA